MAIQHLIRPQAGMPYLLKSAGRGLHWNRFSIILFVFSQLNGEGWAAQFTASHRRRQGVS
jgi:hypothetical protein